jgi:hypothetical protein
MCCSSGGAQEKLKKGWNSSFSWISPLYEQTQGSGACVFPTLLGAVPTGTASIALDPTFGSFTSLEPVSHDVNWVFWWKCSDCLDRNEVFWCSECVHNVQHLIYWQGQRVRDALLIPPLHAHMNVLTPSSVYDVKTLVGQKVIWMKCNH